MFVLNIIMDRDKVFVELMKGLMSNPGVVKDRNALNYNNIRMDVIDMAKNMTNLIMKEIKDEDEI